MALPFKEVLFNHFNFITQNISENLRSIIEGNDIPETKRISIFPLLSGKKKEILTSEREHAVEVTAVTQAIHVTYAMRTDREVSHNPTYIDTRFQNIGRDDKNVLEVHYHSKN